MELYEAWSWGAVFGIVRICPKASVPSTKHSTIQLTSRSEENTSHTDPVKFLVTIAQQRTGRKCRVICSSLDS